MIECRNAVWVSQGTLTAPEGQPFAAPLLAVDPDNDVVSYSAANLPVGAQLDPVTGILSWTPNFVQVGKYDGIILTASDGNLSAGTITFAGGVFLDLEGH